MDKFANSSRRAFVIAVHLALVAIANHVAFRLRFDGPLPGWAWAVELRMLPWLLLIRGLTFFQFRVYRGLWRYAGLWDARNIVASVATSSIAFYLALLVARANAYPRSVLMIDALLLVFLCGGIRMAARVWRERRAAPPAVQEGTRKILIYGAGQAGEMIARDIRKNALYRYAPIGFVDDDRSKVGQSIHGLPVLGTRKALPRLIAEHEPDEVLIAMPSAEAAAVRDVVRALEACHVQITVLPNLRDILNGVVTVNEIRALAIEDLLPRAPVGIDDGPLRDLLIGRRVLVTGAGGSIGSELCMQIAALQPHCLVLYEQSENSLYTVMNRLADKGLSSMAVQVLGDIKDAARLDSTFAQYRPEVVFHAAAHKHVPLMEANPCEAVKNNVMGTRMVAEAAIRHDTRRFVLISTDKAVNPSSVMGATKRVAELVLGDMAKDRTSSTAFLTVRFGNVLGSNGSAVPRFIEQIKAGGPITITHPEIRRYFMLLPEAVQLILHVAGQGRNGGTYVLDMGEQIRIADMARNLIRLSGLVPDEDIKLSFVGLRPGEKLFEELINSRESVQACAIHKTFEVINDAPPAAGWLTAERRKLERAALAGNASDVMRTLRRIIPEFTGRPWDIAPEATGKLRTAAVAIPLLAATRWRPEEVAVVEATVVGQS